MIQKILPYDKALHLIAGVFIFLISMIFVSETISISIVLAIGILKEVVWDLALKKGTPEIADVIYTFGGGALVLILLKFI